MQWIADYTLICRTFLWSDRHGYPRTLRCTGFFLAENVTVLVVLLIRPLPGQISLCLWSVTVHVVRVLLLLALLSRLRGLRVRLRAGSTVDLLHYLGLRLSTCICVCHSVSVQAVYLNATCVGSVGVAERCTDHVIVANLLRTKAAARAICYRRCSMHRTTESSHTGPSWQNHTSKYSRQPGAVRLATTVIQSRDRYWVAVVSL